MSKKYTHLTSVVACLVGILCLTACSAVLQMHNVPTAGMESTIPMGSKIFINPMQYLTYTPVKANDIIVLHYPEGDTVISGFGSNNYYLMVRNHALELQRYDKQGKDTCQSLNHYIDVARQQILDQYEIVVRSTEAKEKYLSRCVALPGNTFSIVDGQIHIDGKPANTIETIQFRYLILTDGSRLNAKAFDLKQENILGMGDSLFSIALTDAKAETFRKVRVVQSVEKQITAQGKWVEDIFPHDARYPWNIDNFGPLWIPRKGVSIKIDTSNIVLYERIITAYEHNDLEIKDGNIFINGEVAEEYTFMMDYYWVMGDNRHDSLDSRYWGFVPEDHLVGIATPM